ncbi:MAG: hypothetical protein AAFU49_03005 [Pseudomonadota bacterium]
MLPAVLSEKPLDFAEQSYMPHLLGVSSHDLAASLMAVAPLRPLLDQRVEEILGDPEDLPIGEFSALVELLNADLDALDRIARIVAVLVHAPSLATTTDGAILRLIVAHTGTREIVRCLDDQDSPVFECLPHTVYVTQELLDLYTQQVLRYMMGLIPPRLMQRVIVRFPEGALPAPDTLTDRPADRATLLALVETALALLPGVTALPTGSEEAGDAAH